MKIKKILIFSFASLLITAVLVVGFLLTPTGEMYFVRVMAERGDVYSQISLGLKYQLGMDVKNLHEAERWYHKAAEQRSDLAKMDKLFVQYKLGRAYQRGEGAAKNPHEAVRWYRKAAEQGYNFAQYELGLAYEVGNGVEKDLHEAIRWYDKVVEQDGVMAELAKHRLAEVHYVLGLTYAIGEGVVKNQREAIRWYHKAAEQGNAWAQLNLGWAYDTGEGVAKDSRQSVRWYRKSAEQGNAWAQLNLGRAYATGEGVAKDSHQSIRWYRKAAEQGNAAAQFSLGWAYDTGKGVEKNSREAVQWYHKAAEQGRAGAQYNLGVAYYNGEGVIRDDREAYIWFAIAKANDNKNAIEFLSKTNWYGRLSLEETRSARKVAISRLQEIENRKDESEEKTDVGASIATGLTPKGTNVAERVFENAWRSVVVVINGDNQGSGAIIRPNIVATNCHVVDEGGGIAVYKSVNRRADTETAFTATIRRSDEERDFCLLDVEGLWGIPATVRRYDTLKVGEDVYGLGAPQGLDLSLSDGLVSQLRKIDGQRIIQTNVAISPGSSGGGLFDSEGNLVGVMTSKITDEDTEGIGFAIPADLVLEF